MQCLTRMTTCLPAPCVPDDRGLRGLAGADRPPAARRLAEADVEGAGDVANRSARRLTALWRSARLCSFRQALTDLLFEYNVEDEGPTGSEGQHLPVIDRDSGQSHGAVPFNKLARK